MGIKLWLTEQAGPLPETALILQATVPTGADALSSGQLQPQLSWLYGWDVIPDRLTLAGSTLGFRDRDDGGHDFVTLAQSVTLGYGLTERFGAYTEWYALFPTSAVEPGLGPQHFFNGGFTYLVGPNFQLDIRAGLGLNRRADDFFTGTGFVVRY
ncbi:MAG TPA: transporter [Gemmataceae bacterium]